MRRHPPARATDRVALAVGRGLLAGLAGTAAMTVSSTVEYAAATGLTYDALAGR